MSDPKRPTRTWGCRFFVTDALALGSFVTAAMALRRMGSPLWWLLALVAGHFFLFCNVFRVRRRLELGWAIVFLINSGAWLWWGRLEWLNVLACQLPITVGCIGAEVRSRQYHGLFARRVNPNLDDYLEGRIP